MSILTRVTNVILTLVNPLKHYDVIYIYTDICLKLFYVFETVQIKYWYTAHYQLRRPRQPCRFDLHISLALQRNQHGSRSCCFRLTSVPAGHAGLYGLIRSLVALLCK